MEVYETDTWGNLLTIDGMVMLSEKDEFVYHEMLVHVAMFAHPNPERVLIVGGGDGGSAREVLRHASVQQVDMVEIDETVVRASKQFLPEVGAFGHPKLNVIYEDGIAFVENIDDPYDVIIVDGSDPVGPAVGLFEKDFYECCYNGLADKGVLTAQTETPWVPEYKPSVKNVHKALSDLFPSVRMYLCYIPLYPTGMWSMMYASKQGDVLDEDTLNRGEQGMNRFGDQLKYYNLEVHKGAFALPNFVKKVIS